LPQKFFTAANLPRGPFFGLRERASAALGVHMRDIAKQITTREKCAFHRCFCHVRTVRCRVTRARKFFSR